MRKKAKPSPASAPAESASPSPEKRKRRRKLHEVSLENDIRYCGPLSYQGFQILGWLCIVSLAVSVMLRLNMRVNPDSEAQLTGLNQGLSYVASLSLPFLLIANFCRILNNTEGYRKQLIRNIGAAAAIFLVVYFLYSRYVAGTLKFYITGPESAEEIVSGMVSGATKHGFEAFNIFVDLALCTLFMFFMNARPARFFTGKKQLLFRFLAILPVAYEIISMVLKCRSALGHISLPVWSYALLTVKPPMTFLLFMLLAIHMKTRERRFCRHGRTHEEYQAFLHTRRNSLHFSVYLGVVMVIAAVLDILVLILLTAVLAVREGAVGAETAVISDEIINQFLSVTNAMGFGDSVPLLFAAPLVLLLSYTRKPRSKSIGLLIPVAAIVLILLVAFEGVRAMLIEMASRTEPLSIDQLMQMNPIP